MSIYWLSEVPDNAPYTGSDSRVAIDSRGVVHLLYVNGTTSSLRYAKGTLDPFFIFRGGVPSGEKYNWTKTDLDVPFADSNFLDLAVDSTGRAHVCFRGLATINGPSAVVHAVWNETSSQFVRTAVENLPELSGLAMTIGKDDSVHLAYAFEAKANSFRVKHATRARDTDLFQLEDVDLLTGGISNLSIAASSNGTIGITYIHHVTGSRQLPPLDEFHLLYAENSGAGWHRDTAAVPMVTGTPPFVPGTWFVQTGTNSLVMDGNGVPHIAYFAAGLGLRHTTWSSGPGTWLTSAAGAGETVDAAGQPVPAKILLDQSNVLHIAYQAQVPGGGFELRFATRARSGGWATATIDPSVNSGWAISAALDATGYPHVSYGYIQIASELDLKHIYAVNITRLLPGHKNKRPILRRP